MQPEWLDWAKRLQAIAQSGLTYSKDPFDIERMEQVRGISAEITAHHTDEPAEKLVGLFSAETGYATPKVGVRAAIFRENGSAPEILILEAFFKAALPS